MHQSIRRLATPVVAALAAVVALATPSTAATTSEVEVTFTEADPTWGTITHVPACDVFPGTARYREVQIDVSASGSYTVEGLQDRGQSFPVLAVRRADGSCPATYAQPEQVSLDAGTHDVIIASIGGVGSFVTFRFTGPGTVAIRGELPDDLAELCTLDPADVPAPYTAVVGTSAFDRLVGTSAREVFFGGAGNDTIDGRGGDDVLCGGEGQDTLNGGDGDDVLVGGTGQDTLNGGVGADELDGGDGQDVLNGNAGDDELRGGAGNDLLDGGAGTDLGVDTAARTVFRGIETRQLVEVG